MSWEVDERVVQMQFDNAQFERGTRQTMGTLEKLKQSLQNKGVEKGKYNNQQRIQGDPRTGLHIKNRCQYLIPSVTAMVLLESHQDRLRG